MLVGSLTAHPEKIASKSNESSLYYRLPKKGKYSCNISNSFGTKEDSSTLGVRAAPLIKQGVKDVEAKEGEKDFTFTVQADAYPEPKITW